MALQPSNFLVITKACSAPNVRLVCFPHSGGGPSAFASWPNLLDEKKVEVVAVSAPGRERRIDDKPFTDWKVFVAEICNALSDSGIIDDVPYAFYGHSFGAVLAYESARHLDATMKPFRPRPIHVFVSAHTDPGSNATARSETEKKFSGLDDAALLKAVESFGFLPEELAADANLAKAVVPALRADLHMYETWHASPDRKPLPCSITAFGGQDDTSVPETALRGWGNETSAHFEHMLFKGGHFYVDDHRDNLLVLIHGNLQRSLKALPLSIEKSKIDIPALVHTHTFQDILKMKAAERPNMEAIVDEHERLTYKEFVRRIDLLAMHLLSMGLKRLEVVALLRPHDIGYCIGFMAIYSANTIFLVIEAHFPPEMAKEIGEESGCKAALCSPEYTVKFQGWCELGIFEMSDNWVAELDQKNVQAQIPQVDLQDTCILMMTSGTTGRPKTIAGSNFFMTLGQYAKGLSNGYSPDDRHAHNVMFVWEVMAPLMFDLPTFCIPDTAVVDPQLFVKYLEQWQCTRTLTTPSLLNTILKYCAQDLGKKLASMTLWLTCGEVLPLKTVNQFHELLPNVRIVNDYSTWESGDIAYALVDAEKYYVPSKVFACAGECAVGNCSVIVDPDTLEILPRGIPGELYVGGPNMSYGYYGKPELTAEKFKKPWCKEMVDMWDKGWYKCGDLGRFVGEPPVLEIRGRIDSTVKIRGFKVGIPVVEAAIQECPGIAMAAVAPLESTPGTVEALCAFITPHDNVEWDAAVQSIKKGAVKKIPRWMIPTYFKPMPDSCLSGGEAKKLNRQKLKNAYSLQQLKDEAAAQQEAAEAEVPEAGAEGDEGGVRGLIRKVWARSLNLNVRTLDLEDNFFDLGGHSTLAARMAAELAGEYGLPITVLDIYSNSSLGALLDLLDPQGAVEVAATLPRRARGPIGGGIASGEARLAIVGIAGRFPGANDTEEFWQNLSKGTVSATFLSPEFLRKKGIAEDVITNKEFVPCAYMINDADKFDNQYFGIGRHEATIMDPQHRVFIEMAHAAQENAALAPHTGLADDVVGVFAAAGIDGYLVHHLDGRPLKDTMDPQDIFLAEIGSEKDYIATRVAYLLDFTGPALNVNSACSSALVACSQAATAISSGQCDSAVFGASSITFPNLGYRYQDGLVNSVDGYVRPFDAAADGTVFGDSVGACIIRRMEDVRETPGSLMWAAVRGFAVSNDGGQKAGYAAPSSTGQSQAITSALNFMQTDPWSLSYVECHCTGTRIGDGIEMRGLMDAFTQAGGKKEKGQASVALGSVKGNIAHANCAAGVTGLMKMLLMYQSGMVAPTANFKTLNPKIKLDDTPFYVNGELCKWDTGNNVTVRSGVSAFGIGGTNAHIVVEEAPKSTSAEVTQTWDFQILPFSAKTPEALRQGVESVAAHVRQVEGGADDVPKVLTSVAYTLQTGRAALPLRKTVVVTSKVSESSLATTATSIEDNVPSLDELEDLDESQKKPAVAFLFPGQGSQYLGMGAGLYKGVPLFRAEVDRCCEMLLGSDLLGMDLRPILLSSDSATEAEFSRPSVLQPCLFVIEYAMLQLLTAVGVTPVAAGGHSLGEYSACVCGGLLTLEAALKIVVTRSKSTETLAEDGAMLSVSEWSDDELQAIQKGERPGLWLAAINSPVHAVISGETSAIEALEAELKATSRSCTRLHIQKAFHSGLIAKAADTLKGLGIPEEDATSTVPVVSNHSGGWMSTNMLKSGSYWSDHMRNAVFWRQNAETMLTQWTPAVVLEVGPGNALSSLTKKCVGKDAGSAPTFVQTMRHPKSSTHDIEHFLVALGQLWESGCDINWQALHREVLGVASPPALARLPPYPFRRTSLWESPAKSAYVEGDAETEASAGPASAPSQSSCLVRFADASDQEPSIRAYCLPFAGGSSMLFAPWATEAGPAIDVVAVELPGRGRESDSRLPAGDADDAAVIANLAKAIFADLRGLPYVLVGFSMGGNLSVELTMQLAMQDAPLPLAVYIAGRKPPASNPGAIVKIDWTDEALSSYAMAPEDVVKSVEFKEHALPLLRADLELDLRVERRLSSAVSAGRSFPPSVPLEVFCGTNDNVAPWADASSWEKVTQVPVGVHFMPGGHEFLRECRPMLLAAWKRDAIGRLVQRRSAELANLAAMGFAASGVASSSMSPVQSGAPSAPAEILPLHAVRWLQVTPKPIGATAAPTHLIGLGAEPTQATLDGAVAAVQNGSTLVLSCKPIYSALKKQTYDVDTKQAWNFVRLIQHLLEAGVSGRLVIACPVAETCGMVVGASKAVAMEASELTIQRIFIPLQYLGEVVANVASLMTLADRYPEETDLWVKESATDFTLLKSPIFVPRLEPMLEPSLKIPCLSQTLPDGEPAVYLLTGATGGLGTAVIEWIVNSQKISPEQLVLVRRSGSSALSGVLAQCKTVEVSSPDEYDSLVASGLKDIRGISGIFHLAGILDDGVIGGMTQERMLKVAKPKSGMALALLNAAKTFGWPVQWLLAFSSTSSLFGYGGQVNYCAANGVLDQLATFGADTKITNGDTLPCRVLAINWGPWGEAGMSKVGTKAYELAVKEGDTPLKTAVALRCLAAVLRSTAEARGGAVQFAACDVQWQKSQWCNLPILELVTEAAAEQKGVQAQSPLDIKSSSAATGRGSLEEYLATYFSSTWSRVSKKSLAQLGLDSLEIVQLRNALNKHFRVNVPQRIVADPSQRVNDLVTALEAYLGK